MLAVQPETKAAALNETQSNTRSRVRRRRNATKPSSEANSNGGKDVLRSRRGASQVTVCGCTMSVKLEACCSEPEVAVTVTEDVTGFEWPEEFDGLPTQAVRPESESRLRARRSQRARLRRKNPRKQTSAVEVVMGSQGFRGRRTAAADCEAETVRVETMFPCPDMVAGAKLQVTPAGRPEHAKTTDEEVENPFCGATVTVFIAIPPALTVSEGVESAIVKSGAGPVPLVTVSTAGLLGTEPALLLTRTLKVAPLSAAVVAGVV